MRGAQQVGHMKTCVIQIRSYVFEMFVRLKYQIYTCRHGKSISKSDKWNEDECWICEGHHKNMVAGYSCSYYETRNISLNQGWSITIRLIIYIRPPYILFLNDLYNLIQLTFHAQVHIYFEPPTARPHVLLYNRMRRMCVNVFEVYIMFCFIVSGLIWFVC